MSPHLLGCNFFIWSKLMMLKLHFEEAKISVSDTSVQMAATWSDPWTLARREKSASPCNLHLPGQRQWAPHRVQGGASRRLLTELFRQEMAVDLTSGQRGRRKDLPRLDIVDVHAYQAV